MPVSIKWLSLRRSWFQIKTEGKVICIDPAYCKSYQKQVPELQEKADLILITHAHKDHCQLATLSKLRRADTLVVAPERCTKGIDGNMRVIGPGEEITVDDIVIKAVYAYNVERAGSSKKIWHRKGDGVGYVITLEGRTIYHAGDTDLIPEMRELGIIHAALLPIGGRFTMDIEEAVKAAIAIKPRIAIPMHDLGADRQEFKDKVEARSHIRVPLLRIGEAYYLE